MKIKTVIKPLSIFKESLKEKKRKKTTKVAKSATRNTLVLSTLRQFAGKLTICIQHDPIIPLCSMHPAEDFT